MEPKDKTHGRRRFLSFVTREMVNNSLNIFTGRDGVLMAAETPFIAEDGFLPFHVNISSLLFIWNNDDNFAEKDLQEMVKKHFEAWSGKQLGAHLFSTQLGKLQMIYLLVDDQTDTITCTETHDLHSIYPTLRNEEQAGVQKLVLGIFFGACDKKRYRTLGNRLYHRNEYSWLQMDNCWEIDEQMLEERFARQWHEFSGRPHFAMYVCCSAKLLIQDNCVPKGRTRSFIQQGGVVIVEGELSIRVKELKYCYSFADCLNDGVLVPINKKLNAKEYENPVLFLGATNSRFDSICWDLTVNQQKSVLSSKPSFILTLPEGGYLEAIEKWEPGIEEIWARHGFERLYESNINRNPTVPSYSKTEFKVPNAALTAKILGMTDPPRTVRCEHKVKLSQNVIKILESRPQPPPVHTFRKLFKVKGSALLGTKNLYGMSIPPAYPPIEYKINNIWHYLYLPNNKETKFTEHIHEHYKSLLIEGKPEWCLQYGDSVYRLRTDKTIIMDEFETNKHKEQKANRPETERWALCDGSQTRLGTDGWIYKSTGKVISSYETKYYYRYK